MRGVDVNFYLDADPKSTSGMTKVGTSRTNSTRAISAQRPDRRFVGRRCVSARKPIYIRGVRRR